MAPRSCRPTGATNTLRWYHPLWLRRRHPLRLPRLSSLLLSAPPTRRLFWFPLLSISKPCKPRASLESVNLDKSSNCPRLQQTSVSSQKHIEVPSLIQIESLVWRKNMGLLLPIKHGILCHNHHMPKLLFQGNGFIVTNSMLMDL